MHRGQLSDVTQSSSPDARQSPVRLLNTTDSTCPTRRQTGKWAQQSRRNSPVPDRRQFTHTRPMSDSSGDAGVVHAGVMNSSGRGAQLAPSNKAEPCSTEVFPRRLVTLAAGSQSAGAADRCCHSARQVQLASSAHPARSATRSAGSNQLTQPIQPTLSTCHSLKPARSRQTPI